MTEPAFRDHTLPRADRVADLLGRLGLAEKIALLHQYQAAVPRLGLAAFRTGTEALHGLAWLGRATVFPQAIGLASSWNPALLRDVGTAVGEEVRGSHHKDPEGAGLNVWAPVVNPLRDPRWGRNEEGYSEDPWLTGVLATAYASGLAGDHPGYLRTAPALKHFLGYNNETRRETTSSNLPPRVLREYELPAFRAAILAGAAVAVMPSYNLVNGRPAHLSPLINAELRDWAGDGLLIVTDAQAPSNVVKPQAYYEDHATGHAALLRAGVDSFTDSDDEAAVTAQRINDALDRGLLIEDDIDRAVARALALRFRLGEFDPPDQNPYAAITDAVINCAAHQALARDAARQAIVLLKNADATLPLTDPARIAVIGPLADIVQTDWYSGTLPYSVTARAGLAARYGEAAVGFAEGVDRIALRLGDGYLSVADGAEMRLAPEPTAAACFDVLDWGNGVYALRSPANGRYLRVDPDGLLRSGSEQPGGWLVQETFRMLAGTGDGIVLHHLATDAHIHIDADGVARAQRSGDGTSLLVEVVIDGVAEAAALAAGAEVAVVVLGNHPMINGRETEDRADLALPAGQDRLLRAVHAANPTVVLVLTSSYPYSIEWAQERVPAIAWTAHGGQEFGTALAEVLSGDRGPGGRLTQTWYASGDQLPDLLDYDIIATDATYLYRREAPLYPLGHGLTYSEVDYHDLRLSTVDVDASGELIVSVRVTNAGDREVDEVVQLYTRQMSSRVKQPLRQLRGFQRLTLPPKGSASVDFRLRMSELAFWDVTRDRYVVEAAEHTVFVGRSSGDLRLSATLTVRGEVIPPRSLLARAIDAVAFDDYRGITLTDATPVDGDAVLATEAGGWIRFGQVDLDSPVSWCQARVGADRPGRIQLRLDDPIDGPIVGSLAVAATYGRHVWTAAATALDINTGIHDLFAVFDSPGLRLWDLTFGS